VDEGKWSCSVDALGSMQKAIKENNLKPVVIASCTPDSLNLCSRQRSKRPGSILFAGVREHSGAGSWVHMRSLMRYTEGEGLVKMGVARPRSWKKARNKASGGQGLHDHRRRRSGHECSAQCGGAGFKAIIVEKSPSSAVPEHDQHHRP